MQPFRQAAEMLRRLAGVIVSARSIESWTEQVGQRYTPPTLAPTAPGPAADVLVLEADAVMTCFHDGWHEEKVAMAWRIDNGVAQSARYVTGEGTWEKFTPSLAALARREGSRLARQLVCIADGAPAIWLLLTRCYPDAFQLLDWYHVQEHLAQVATVLGEEGAAWHAAQREALRRQGAVSTLWSLRGYMRTGATPAVRKEAQKCFQYLWRNRHRLDYPTALQRGYPIGSGRIESGCKQIVQQRAKLAGMRWSHPHLQAVMTARCAFFNGDWDLACAQYEKAA